MVIVMVFNAFKCQVYQNIGTADLLNLLADVRITQLGYPVYQIQGIFMMSFLKVEFILKLKVTMLPQTHLNL